MNKNSIITHLRSSSVWMWACVLSIADLGTTSLVAQYGTTTGFPIVTSGPVTGITGSTGSGGGGGGGGGGRGGYLGSYQLGSNGVLIPGRPSTNGSNQGLNQGSQPAEHSFGMKLSRNRDNLNCADALPLTGFVPGWLRDKYDAQSIFLDASADDQYYKYAVDLNCMGIVEGYANSGFIGLENALNRAELAKIISYAMELQLVRNTGGSTFSDVPAQGEWFSDYVESIAYYGVVDGYPDGSYQPSRSVDFGETLKIVSNAFGFSTNEMGSTWQEPFYNALRARNIIPESMLNKAYGDVMLRGEIFALISRAAAVAETTDFTYNDEVMLSIPSLGIFNLASKNTLLSDSSVWLDALTNVGGGYYYETVTDTHVVFGHSSIWPGDPTPVGPVFKPMLDPAYGNGDTFELTIDGETSTYEIVETLLIDQEEIDVIRSGNEGVDAIIFTCREDITKRKVVKGRKI